MQCLSGKSKKFVSLGVIVCCLPFNAWSVEEKRLWLPQKYQTHFLELKKAAESAESLNRCVKVLRGTIDLDESKPGHPIYRILCRQKDMLNYNEMVDGLSFETLTTKIEIPSELSPEEIEAARLAEEKRLADERAARISRHWVACEASLKQETRLFQKLKWLQQFPPEPVTSEELLTKFSVDFDASNAMGKTLKYTATCEIEESKRVPDSVESVEVENSEKATGGDQKDKSPTVSNKEDVKGDAEKAPIIEQGPPVIKIRSRKK